MVRRKDGSGLTALVTGASSGIGEHWPAASLRAATTSYWWRATQAS